MEKDKRDSIVMDLWIEASSPELLPVEGKEQDLLWGQFVPFPMPWSPRFQLRVAFFEPLHPRVPLSTRTSPCAIQVATVLVS